MYNYTQLTEGSNIVHWLLIANSWGDTIPFTLIIGMTIFLIYGVMKSNGVPNDDAVIASSFAGLIISTVAWSIRWEEYILINSYMPLFFLIILGGSVFFKYVRGWLQEV